MVKFEQLELRDTNDTGGPNQFKVDAQAWIGYDLNKLWIKTEAMRRDGITEDAEVQALFSHAIAPFWDLQAGMRHDKIPDTTRDWGVIGVKGLAPYFFDVDTALFVGESGHTAARFKAEYEMLFTQRLILTPSVEVNFYGQNDAETGAGAGLSDAEAGLRLRYEISREFAPYLGMNWNRKFGNAAEFAKTAGETESDAQWVIGLRAWF
jgi:copper resistance protein B